MTVTEVLNIGNDVLLVRGVDAAGNKVEAHGWVSATTNHLDPGAFNADGTQKADAKRRELTPAEVGGYARRLFDEQHPDPKTEKPVPFK